MELKDFISETIKQITDEILEGNTYVKERSNSSEGIRNQYTKIDFDIAVSTNKENKNDFDGKINVVQIFNAGGSKSKVSSTTNQRIKFEVLASINTK